MADAKKPQPGQSRWLNKRLGKFRLLSLLGQGAMGKVFLAEDTTLKRQVALKVLPAKLKNGEPDAKAKQFVREARAAAKLNHPHIVNVLEIDQQQDLLYIAMDLVQGGDVKQLIKTGGPLPAWRACDFAADAAEALAFGHGLGVVHRDVKPGNLMLTRDGRCKLADFGLADLGDPNDDFRLPDGIIGTPATMAPEVARGLPALPASDQYSLACTLWKMLTGESVFAGKNVKAVLEQQVNEEPPNLAELCPDLPAALVDAVHQALSKDPDERHADCETFGRMLRSHAMALQSADASSSMSRSSAYAVAVKPSNKNKTPWIVGGAAAVLALGIGGAAVVMNGGESGTASNPEQATQPVATSSAGQTTPSVLTTPVEPATPVVIPEFSADQTDQIKPLVRDDATITVTGQVESAELSSSGKTFMVKFVGNDRGDFQVIWKPRTYEAMGEALGGEHGEGVAGKTIRVTGELSSMFGAPQIDVRSPGQVEVVE